MSMDEFLKILVDKKVIELSVKDEDPFKPTSKDEELLIYKKNDEIKSGNEGKDKALSLARIKLKSIQEQQCGESIPTQELPKYARINHDIEIIMGEIWSPSKFSILLKSFYSKLVELGREMTVFYGDRSTEHLMLSESHVVVGQICAVREGIEEDGDWYRSMIVNVLDTQTVTVHDIDYGQRRKVQLGQIRFLRRDFAESLNAQAIPSKLAHVIPTNNSKTWSIIAKKYFAELAKKSKDEGLFGVIKGLHQGMCRKLSLLLYDTVTNDFEDGIQINQELVAHHLAEVDPCEANESYEFPITGITKPLLPVNPNLAPLRLPSFLNQNVSSGYGDSGHLEPTFIEQPDNNKKSWVPSFIPKIAQVIKDVGASSNIVSNDQCNSQKLTSISNKVKEVSEVIGTTSLCERKRSSSDTSECTARKVVRKVVLPNNNSIHVISVDDCQYVTSAEISALIPKWKKKDVLEQMIELKKIQIPKKILTQEDHEDFFQELILSEVKGLTTPDESLVKRLVIYCLEYIPNLIHIFHGKQDTEMEDLVREIELAHQE